MSDRPKVLVVGLSARALAESGTRAGFAVIAVDAYGDLDLEAVAHVITCRPESGRGYTPLAAARAVRSLAVGAVAYLSNFENYPTAVRLVSEGRTLWGNSPEILARVRDPILLARTLRRRGFDVPDVRSTAAGKLAGAHRWLVKPRRSGGGQGIAPWHLGDPVGRGTVLQERITGTPGSILFAADGRHVMPLGVSRQLVGARSLGVRGFRYCGSILGSSDAPVFPRYDSVVEVAASLASAVTEEFGLVGLNGVDFIACDGVPYPIEVNPRYSAAMELVERAHGVSLFDVHARACQGTLPKSNLLRRPRSVAYGKGIVFARRTVMMGDTRRWARDPSIRDVPHPGSTIDRGRPICTVFAEAREVGPCRRAIFRRAEQIYVAAEARRWKVA